MKDESHQLGFRMPGEKEHIIYFDGVCNLCNGFVQFIIRRDPKAKFSFAPLQSESGQEMLSGHGRNPKEFDSVLYQKDGKLLVKSRAVLEILNDLGGLWSVFAVLKVLPARLGDLVYDQVAGNRYRWFGRKNACMVPSPDLSSRFLS